MLLTPKTSNNFKLVERAQLWLACHSGDYNLCVELISEGANLQLTDSNKRTPLWISSYRGIDSSNVIIILHY